MSNQPHLNHGYGYRLQVLGQYFTAGPTDRLIYPNESHDTGLGHDWREGSKFSTPLTGPPPRSSDVQFHPSNVFFTTTPLLSFLTSAHYSLTHFSRFLEAELFALNLVLKSLFTDEWVNECQCVSVELVNYKDILIELNLEPSIFKTMTQQGPSLNKARLEDFVKPMAKVKL